MHQTLLRYTSVAFEAFQYVIYSVSRGREITFFFQFFFSYLNNSYTWVMEPMESFFNFFFNRFLGMIFASN